jgi:Mce-associated membrane protein
MKGADPVRTLMPAPRPATEDDSAPARPARPRTWRPWTAVVLVLALLGCGAALAARTQQLTGAPALHNRALTDTEATSRVAGEVGGALARVFSYGPGDTATTRKAARRLLAGKAARQYEALFGQVEQRAARQRLTLTTHVVRAGVTRLDHRGAHLLVFLDQVAQRAGKPATTVAAQLSVTAELHEGRWRIVDIRSR